MVLSYYQELKVKAMIEQQETEKGTEQFHDWLSHLSFSGKWSMQVKIYLGLSYVCVLDAIVL